MKFFQAAVIGLAEFANGLVADLTDTLALQIHILSNLGHRLVLLPDAEEGIHHPTLALVERTEGKLDGGLDCFGVDTLIGQRGILIDEYGEQTHVGTVA